MSFRLSETQDEHLGLPRRREATSNLSLTINQSGNYTQPDEGQGKISAIGPNYLMIQNRKLIWDSNTNIIVNTPNGELHVIDSFVKVGMKAQWKGLRDKATDTTLIRKLEMNY